ncbi:MAG: hypothetical protein D6784_07555, partial [Chloroflexi bacterium]
PDSLVVEVSGLVHCARMPKTASLTRPAPAVVMLHGWGGDEAAMWVFRQAVPAAAAIITPRAPIDPGIGGYVWFTYLDAARAHPDPGVLQSSLKRLRHFLHSLPDVYPVDPARLVLVGFSQGAAMVNSIVLGGYIHPLGVVSLAGFIPNLPGRTTGAVVRPNLPVFIAHGLRDDVVSVEEGRRVRDLYTRQGANVTYREDPVGHKVHTRTIKALKSWLDGLLQPAS